MTDEKESNFKVTDRRKFNADGSPRGTVAEQPAAKQDLDTRANDAGPQPISAEPRPPEPSDATAPEEPPAVSTPSNVFSFPGEAATRKLEPADAPSASASRPRPAPVSASPESHAAAASTLRDEQRAAEKAFNTAAGPRGAGIPEASFLNLLNMLAVEAAMHLGMIHPEGQEPLPIDLESARHLIDLLAMLQAKTRGNLTAEEDGLLENILADLRMQFVAVSKGR